MQIKFKDWPIWFVLHIKDNKIIALEEHDLRAGGHITPRKSQTYKELFLQEVPKRFTDAKTVEEAKELVKNLE